jgi:TPR repeat protein
MWEFLSAINGHSYAQYNFAYCACYSHGKYDSIDFDFDDGFKLMELSANQGYTNSCLIVAETYLGINAREYEKHLINIEKGIDLAEKLKAEGIHDFDELIDKYLTTGSID